MLHLKYILTFIVFALFSGCSFDEDPAVFDPPVIEAFLFANEPIDDIRISKSSSLDQDTIISDPVMDAEVSLIKNNITYPLINFADSGYYHYPGTDLTVETGDEFTLEVRWQGQLSFGTTIVPPPPDGVSIDTIIMEIPTLGPGIGPVLAELNVNVTWENQNNLLHFVALEYTDPLETAEFIYPDFVRDVIDQFRIITEPTTDTLFTANALVLKFYGNHRVSVYRVNREYAELYTSRDQDSRDLNEPPSNIINGIGIFSAFNSRSVFFDVLKE